MDNCAGSNYVAIMDDGRMFTDYRGNCQVRQLQRGCNTEVERMSMIAHAQEIIVENDKIARKRARVCTKFIHPDAFGHDTYWDNVNK